MGEKIASKLGREELRIGRAFAAILAAFAPALGVQACSSGGGGTGSADAGHPTIDAGHPTIDAGLDGDTDADAFVEAATMDAGMESSCLTQIEVVDASADGELYCQYRVPCGLGTELYPVGCDIWVGADGSAMPIGCRIIDGQGCEEDAYSPGPMGAVTLFCDCLMGSGRRPAGLARTPMPRASSALGAYFARMAHDEAASVLAFERMRDELACFGAPIALVRAAARSARDEARHARSMARRAHAEGAAIASPRVRRRRCARTLEAVALENAVEGCVRETFGALVLSWQARLAGDAALRETFARIAVDEARHAALSWAVAAWAEERLDVEARARVAQGRARAVRALRRTVGSAPPLLEGEIGTPGPSERVALLERMLLELGLEPSAA